MNGPEDRTRLRITVVGLVVFSMFAVLLARLWFLQVLAGDTYAAAAQRNYVRLDSVEAPRGRILDRNGGVLVKNDTALAVGIRRSDLADMPPLEVRKVKARLARLLGMTPAAIDRRLADRRSSPYEAVVIKTGVARDVVFTIRERQEDYGGVRTLTLPVRAYPQGSIAAHVLGYTGEVNESELQQASGKYRLGDTIGRTGIERTYEQYLRGISGIRKVEVDASGHVLRELGVQDAVPGADVQLSIDAKIQTVAEQALSQGITRARGKVFRETGRHFKAPAGAVVVLDAKTGAVVAMASHPTFDLSKFVGGVGDKYWRFLNHKNNYFPLLNRAIQTPYPPGSTFKPFMATAALESGLGSPSGRYPCTTEFRFGDRIFHNWQPRNASISLTQSLVESCDTVYYAFARDWWLREHNQGLAGKPIAETMQDWARRFGLGSDTGIDLPQEERGRIPDRAYRRSVWEANKAEYCRRYQQTRDALFQDLCERGFLWRGGDAVNMSVGQGEVEATPLQMAIGYDAIANGGDVLEPHIAMKIVTPAGKLIQEIKRKVRARVGATDASLRYVRAALGQVARSGTAVFPYRGWPMGRFPMAAKTGSAEIGGRQPYSWFASFGPTNDPKYVAVAVVEEAGFGSQVAGPVVRRIMDELFGLNPLPILIGGSADR